MKWCIYFPQKLRIDRTLSELFLRVTDFPSRSISSILTLPVASASWLIWTLGAAPDASSSSTRFLLARVLREDVEVLLAVERDTVTREDGLGDNFSLQETGHVSNHVYDRRTGVRAIHGQLHHENDCLCNYAVVLPFLPIICASNISTADHVSVCLLVFMLNELADLLLFNSGSLAHERDTQLSFQRDISQPILLLRHVKYEAQKCEVFDECPWRWTMIITGCQNAISTCKTLKNTQFECIADLNAWMSHKTTWASFLDAVFCRRVVQT